MGKWVKQTLITFESLKRTDILHLDKPDRVKQTNFFIPVGFSKYKIINFDLRSQYPTGHMTLQMEIVLFE